MTCVAGSALYYMHKSGCTTPNIIRKMAKAGVIGASAPILTVGIGSMVLMALLIR